MYMHHAPSPAVLLLKPMTDLLFPYPVVTVEFVSSSYAANESDGTVTVCMTKDTNTSIDFSITIQPFEMSAQCKCSS